MVVELNEQGRTPAKVSDIQLNLDPSTVSLSVQGSGWSGTVAEAFVELNDYGNTLAKVSDRKVFKATGTDRGSFDRQGVSWPMSVPLVQGATRVTIVVRDSKTGRLGSLTVPLK